MIDNILDSIDYDYYVSLYGTDLIDLVINDMINSNEEDCFMFEFYLIKVLEGLNNDNNDLFSIYMKDIEQYRKFSSSDNNEYINKIYEIICRLNNAFSLIDIEVNNLSYLNEKVDFCLNKCNDVMLLKQIQELYNDFIVLRNKLVEGNLMSVLTMVRPFCNDNVDMIELIQNGNMGLIIAAEKYNLNFNIPFLRYAFYWVKHYIRMGLRLEMNSVSVPYNFLDSNSYRLKAIKVLTAELGREPTYEEISKHTNMSIARIREVEMACCKSDSLSSIVDDGNETIENLDNRLVDNLDISEVIIAEQMKLEIAEKLKKILTPLELIVLSKRHGFNNQPPMTYNSIGLELGKKSASVKWIEQKAYKKIRTNYDELKAYLR